MIGRVTLMSRIVGSIPKMMLAVCTLGMCNNLKSPVIDIPAAAPISGEYAQQKFDVALISGTPFSLVTSQQCEQCTAQPSQGVIERATPLKGNNHDYRYREVLQHNQGFWLY